MTEPAPLRRPEDLRAAVAKASPEYTQKLEAQVKKLEAQVARLGVQVRWLGERTGCALAWAIQQEAGAGELDWPLDEEQIPLWRQFQDMLTEADARSTARREELSSSVEFERALIRVRESLQAHLKAEAE